MYDGEQRFGAIEFTVPDGWNNLGGWILNRGGRASPTVAIQFWNVVQVYGHPCQWHGTLSTPGPTVDDLVAAPVDKPLRNTTQPVDVMLDGVAGTYIEWSVPAHMDFAECDTDGGTHYFESWTGPFDNSDRYQQGPGQVDPLWILDVGGDRLVIDSCDMPIATDAERAELLTVVKSITFGQ